MFVFFRYVLSLVLLVLAVGAQATTQIEVYGAGSNQTPVSIAQFVGENVEHTQMVREIIEHDLKRSGVFKLIDPAGMRPVAPAEVDFAAFKSAGANYMVMAQVLTGDKGRIAVNFRLLDVVNQKEELALSTSAMSARSVAHKVADLIYEKLTGHKGAFSTYIAYVNRDKGRFRLIVADSDGYNDTAIVTQNEPIMSPTWSPDGSKLAYVSFEAGRAMVYVQSARTGKRQLVAGFKGSNSAPAWSPDGKELAVVLTKDGNSQIYLVNSDGTNLRRISNNGSIDTEPAFSPDGQNLLFTSDRGGKAQIYQMSLNGGNAKRLTFVDGSSFSARFSPDGKYFVFTNLQGGRFSIAIQELASGRMTRLTQGGFDKRPSFAPNGRMVLYATEVGGKGVLRTVTVDGLDTSKLSSNGDVRESAWGAYY